LTILNCVHERLAANYAAKGKQGLFDRLQVYLMEKTTTDSYKDVGDELDLTEGAVKTEVSRMRAAWRGLFREEIAQTVETAGEIDDEIRHLFAVLQG
jgi:hypothetical protein